MAVDRAHHRIAEGLFEMQTFTRRILLGVDESLEQGNDENSPMFETPEVQEGAAVLLRPFPRLPLQDITHLFPSNGLSWKNNTRNGGVREGVRRRPLESPVRSKKRRTSEAISSVWDPLCRSAFKSARLSTGLCSLR